MKKKLVSLFLVLFFSLSFCFMSFAATILDLPSYDGDGQWKRIFVDKGDDKYYGYLGIRLTSYTSPVYGYWLHRPSDDANWIFLVSEDKFSCSRYGYRSFSSLSGMPFSFSGDGTMDVKLEESGYYVGYFGMSANSIPSNLISFDGPIPLIYCEERLWDSPDYVLGEDPSGGGSSSSIVYDSSIPAPQNVQFKSDSVGGFLGVGSKWEHTLSWSNGLASPPLFLRVYSVAEVVFADTGQFFEDSTMPLLSADDKYDAGSGRYSVGTDELASKIMDGTVLNKVLEYRLQFCRYGDDGNLNVGPIATVHVKQNLFGKYDGYTVTTEYPKDDTDLGLSGGLDDEYKDKWTSDGEHYDEYDKDGNLIDSGTSEDGGPLDKLLKSLKSIPLLINSFFDSIGQLLSGIGDFPALLSRLFAFMPSEVVALVGLGISVVILLRILGR